MSLLDLIPEEEVTRDRLRELLAEVDLPTEVDQDGDLRVTTDVGTHAYVALDERRRLIKFYTAYRLREDASVAEKLNLANTLNDEVILVRFCVVGTSILVADYFLSYDRGLLPHQFLRSLSWFSQVAVQAVAAYDEDNIVL